MIKVVPKIMTLLELFASGEELSFSEISERAGLTRSNASHLLSALCALGVLSRPEYGVYRRGERLTRLCVGDNPWRELTIMAERYADNIVARLNELAVVGLRCQGRRLTLIKRRPVKNLQVEQENERYHQADWYGTANGRVLLAFAPDALVSEVVRHYGLPSRGIWSAALTLPKLLSELKLIREQRFVVMNVDEEIKAIGVPAVDAAGDAAFCIATAFPIFSCRHSDEEIVELLSHEAGTFEKEMSIRGMRVADLSLIPRHDSTAAKTL
jgi:DNA-binding IclR family transcriptional regulator